VDTEPFCASSEEARSLSEEEFWHRVFYWQNHQEPDYQWDDIGPAPVGFCLRCGGTITAEDYQQLRRIVEEDHEICDDCADEVTEVPDNDPWDENKSIM